MFGTYSLTHTHKPTYLYLYCRASSTKFSFTLHCVPVYVFSISIEIIKTKNAGNAIIDSFRIEWFCKCSKELLFVWKFRIRSIEYFCNCRVRNGFSILWHLCVYTYIYLYNMINFSIVRLIINAIYLVWSI